MTKSFSTTSSQ